MEQNILIVTFLGEGASQLPASCRGGEGVKEGASEWPKEDVSGIFAPPLASTPLTD